MGEILGARLEGRDIVLSLERRKRLDILIAEKVKRAILGSARKHPRNIVLDLQSVDFIDSTAIAMLMEVNQRLSGEGIKFSICGVSKEAMELIQLVPILKSLINQQADDPGLVSAASIGSPLN